MSFCSPTIRHFLNLFLTALPVHVLTRHTYCLTAVIKLEWMQFYENEQIISFIIDFLLFNSEFCVSHSLCMWYISCNRYIKINTRVKIYYRFADDDFRLRYLWRATCSRYCLSMYRLIMSSSHFHPAIKRTYHHDHVACKFFWLLTNRKRRTLTKNIC